MKRIICTIMSLLLAVIMLVGCGKQDSEGTVSATAEKNNESMVQTQEPTQAQTEVTESNGEKQVLTVPFKTVTVKCDADRRIKEEGFATLIYENNDALVAFCMDTVNTYDIELEDVFGVFEKHCPSAAALASQGDLHSGVIKMTESEKITMEGFDSIRFTGTVPNASGWDCHVYGYTFLIDGAPYAVIGIVSQKEQSADLIAANKAEVDEIAASIKNGA